MEKSQGIRNRNPKMISMQQIHKAINLHKGKFECYETKQKQTKKYLSKENKLIQKNDMIKNMKSKFLLLVEKR